MSVHLEKSGADFSYAIVLFQDATAGTPNPEDGEGYLDDVGEPPFPVLSNEAQDILDVVPYTGDPLPGKCLVSPEMELIECNHGHGPDTWAAEAILEHMSK